MYSCSLFPFLILTASGGKNVIPSSSKREIKLPVDLLAPKC